MGERRIKLKVPFGQNYDFSCGPASLMMAMKYFEKGITLSKSLEMDIWREANMIEVYGTSSYGLAFSAATRGFGARIFSNLESLGFVDKLGPEVQGMDRRMLNLLFQERRMRCLELDAKGRRTAISVALLRRELASGSLPLLLTNARYFSDEDLPHWVVVSGLDDWRAYVNNPLSGGAGDAIPLGNLGTAIGYKGDECVVSISKKVSQSRHPPRLSRRSYHPS